MPFSKEKTEKSKKQRAEVIKQSPEWKAMIKLSRNPEFLRILEAYWQKFSTKREKTFEEELDGTIEKPESRHYLEDDKITYGSITLKFLREIENYLGSKVTCNTYFTIFCDLKDNLLICHREFIDGGTVKKFEGTLDEFYDYMKKKLTQQNISYLDLLTKP